MTCRRVGQDQAVRSIGDQDRVGCGVEDRLQVTAAGLHRQEQADIRHCQGRLAGQRADESQVRLVENALFVVGGPEHAVIAFLIAQGNRDQRFGLGQVWVEDQAAVARDRGHHRPVLLLGEREDLVIEMHVHLPLRTIRKSDGGKGGGREDVACQDDGCRAGAVRHHRLQYGPQRIAQGQAGGHTLAGDQQAVEVLQTRL